MTLSRSPKRGTFQLESFLERRATEGRTPENDADVQAMAEYYSSWEQETRKREADPTWRENNLEYDLRSTDWVLDKVRLSESYAQNLYAAMCNNEFQKISLWPVLKGETWTCTWRYAGGIIADMRESGDYIDWYCSGIRDIGVYAPDNGQELSQEQKARAEIVAKFVGEGTVTDEIRQDLKQLGWQVIVEDER